MKLKEECKSWLETQHLENEDHGAFYNCFQREREKKTREQL